MNLYPFIEAEKAQQRNVKRACELLKVSRAAYYAHRAAVPSARRLADEELTEHIRQAPIRRPRAAMAPRASTPSCAARGGGTAASAWPA